MPAAKFDIEKWKCQVNITAAAAKMSRLILTKIQIEHLTKFTQHSEILDWQDLKNYMQFFAFHTSALNQLLLCGYPPTPASKFHIKKIKRQANVIAAAAKM